jgi:hypothetical protein
MVLHGDSNIGKTLITAKFLREHPPVFDEQRGVEQRQVVAMQMPATPDQGLSDFLWILVRQARKKPIKTTR